MANIRDIRRRIRSVKNTRQITKAMKMVSAAKLRRAQERALAARPYALMMTNVLQLAGQPHRSGRSENGRAEASAAGAASGAEHPAGAGDRRPRIGRRFQLERAEGGGKFLEFFKDKNISIAAVGRKGRDYMRRRYPVATPGSATRAGRVQVVGEHLNMLGKLEYEAVSEIVERVIQAYDRCRDRFGVRDLQRIQVGDLAAADRAAHSCRCRKSAAARSL